MTGAIWCHLEQRLGQQRFYWQGCPGVRAMATAEDDSLAYLTMRPTNDAAHEIGAIGHGPAGQALAQRVVEEIARWNDGFRERPIRFAYHPHGTAAPAEPDQGTFVITRVGGDFTVMWQV